MSNTYRNNFEKAQWRKANKQKAVEYKGSKCEDCKQTFPSCVYDFHHVDPSNKKYQMSRLMDYRFESLKEELDKCILLCANCHRLRHSREDVYQRG